jgi:hypothetical protein
MEKILESSINACLQVLYERSYYDFEAKNNIVEFLMAALCFATTIAGLMQADMPFVKNNTANFMEGGIVLPQNKKTVIV